MTLALWLAVAGATVSSIVVGTVWYRPAVFGDRWQALTGIDPNTPTRPALTYAGSFVASAATATVLAVAALITAEYFGTGTLTAALAVGGLLWAGLTAARMLVHDLFANKPLKLWGIDAAYELVTILVMAVIIGLVSA